MADQEASPGFVARGGIWVLAQVVLLAAILLVPHLTPQRHLWTAPLPAAIMMILGTALFGAGLLKLGSSLTPMPHPKDDSELRTSGVYHLVRHPIYGGLILSVAGYAVLFPSPIELTLAVITMIFFDRKATREERWLRDRYPTYGDYAKRTRKLIPLLY